MNRRVLINQYNVVEFAVTMLLPIIVFAQAPDTLWTKRYGDDSVNCLRSIQQTVDGGYVAVGNTGSFGNGGDIWFLRLNPLGDTLWTKTIGGLSGDAATSICPTIDGKYIVVGSTSSYGAGNDDVWLLKVDTLGDTIWANTYGGSSNDVGVGVQQTADGGYVIIGSTYSFGNGNSDVYLIKTDAAGGELWSKTFGGADIDEGRSVIQCPDGGFIIAGGTMSFGSGSMDVYLIKTDSLGDTIWVKTYGSTESDDAWSVHHTTNNKYAVVGHTESYGLGCDVYFIKINELGDTIWTRTFSGVYGGADGYSVRQTYDKGYIIAGLTMTYTNEADVYLIKTDSAGNEVWASNYGGLYDDWGWSVQQTTDSGYIIAGLTFPVGSTYQDGYLIRLGKESSDVWESQPEYMKNNRNNRSTVFNGPLKLPQGKHCRLFDVTGRVVIPDAIKPGVYFIQIDNYIVQKVVKVR